MSPRTTAASRRERSPLSPMRILTHEFLSNWAQAKDAGDKRDAAKKAIKQLFAVGDPRVYTNENGSKFLDFEEPLEVEGRKFYGLENRRSAVQVLNPDRMDDLLDGLKPEHRHAVVSYRVTVPVGSDELDEIRRLLAMRGIDDLDVDIVVDEAELLALQQKGVITDRQLDGLYDTEITWGLYPKLAL